MKSTKPAATKPKKLTKREIAALIVAHPNGLAVSNAPCPTALASQRDACRRLPVLLSRGRRKSSLSGQARTRESYAP